MTRKSPVTKQCQRCGSEKSYSDFHRNMTKTDNHNGICKQCQDEVNQANKKASNKKA